MKTRILYRIIGSMLFIGGLLSTETVMAQISWDKPEKIVRVEKPNRTPPKPRPKPRKKRVIVESTPLLALRWSVRKGGWADAPDPAKQPKPANPETAFRVNDHLQLVVEVNQDGYLYMIQDADLTMIFPDARINNGKNFVKKGQQIIIPSNCDEKYRDAEGKPVVDANGNCWFKVADKDDDLTLIFSRDRIDNLPNSADETGTMTVKNQVLSAVKSGTSQQFSKTNPDAVTVQFTNLNKNDNEELIIETKIRHQ
jgi:hypothetical protein